MVEVLKTEGNDPRLYYPIFSAFNEYPEEKNLDRTSGWLLMESGEVAASALVREKGNLWHIRRLAVLEKHRGKGFGAKIINAIESCARTQGIAELTTVTSKKWPVMRQMIQKKGWLYSKARKSKRSEGIDEHWFLPLVNSPVKVILVGANPKGRGGELAGAIAKLPSLVKLVGICDLDSNYRNYWTELGVAAAPSLQDLLAQGVIAQAVMMALPHNVYEENRKICMSHGLAMFHEKPLACTLFELQNLVAALGKNPVPLVVGTQRRDHPTYVYLKELIQNEEISTLSISMELGKSPTLGSWRGSRQESGGGALIDLGIHAVDLVHHFLGYSLELVSCSLWVENESGKTRPALDCELETAASIIGRCGKTWVKIWVNRRGKKSESVEVIGKSHWLADRSLVSKNKEMLFTCEEDWELALSGRIGKLVADINSKSISFENWDHFSSLRIIEQAYALPTQIGMGSRAV